MEELRKAQKERQEQEKADLKKLEEEKKKRKKREVERSTGCCRIETIGSSNCS